MWNLRRYFIYVVLERHYDTVSAHRMLHDHVSKDKTKNDLPNNFLTSHLKIKTCMYDVFSQPWLSWTRKKKNAGKTLRNMMILLRNAHLLFMSNVMVMAFEFPQFSDFFHHPRWNRKVQSFRSKCYSIWSRVTKTVFSWKGLHYTDMGHSSKGGTVSSKSWPVASTSSLPWLCLQ